MTEITKKISVIVPTYKRETEIIKRAIESIRKQTYKNYEIILIDDNNPGSLYRKENEKMVADYEGNKFVYLKNEQNLGGALSRNKGVKHSSGEFVTFLDDDDIYLSDKLENQIEFMLKNKCDFSFTNLKLYNENNKLVGYRSFEDIKDFSSEGLLKFHLKKHITGTPTFMLRRETFEKIGGFENVLVGQEYHLMLKAIVKNCDIKYLPVSNVIAYKHRGIAISKGMNKIKGEKELYKFKKKYFYILSNQDIKYVKFRHHAVLSVTYFREKFFIKGLSHLLLIAFTTPIIAMNEVYKVIKITSKVKRKEQH